MPCSTQLLNTVMENGLMQEPVQRNHAFLIEPGLPVPLAYTGILLPGEGDPGSAVTTPFILTRPDALASDGAPMGHAPALRAQIGVTLRCLRALDLIGGILGQFAALELLQAGE